MEKIKTIPFPKGYELDFVGTRKVFFKRKEQPDTFKGCSDLIRNRTQMNVLVPNSDVTAVKALCSLLFCLRAWWQQLDWLPNWEDAGKPKYFISTVNGKIIVGESLECEKLLLFPEAEIRNDFLKSFRDLIEQAGYLL